MNEIEKGEEKDELLKPSSSLLNIDDDDDDLFIKPIKKKKVLFLSDHQLSSSGVGVQSRFLIQGLINKGDYTFRCLGGAIKHDKYDPIVVNQDFIVKPVDGFGTKEMIKELLISEQPDALFLFTDPRQFIWIWEMEDEIRQVCPIVYWHVWDNDPFPKFNNPFYESTDLINCLSKKTYDLVKPNFPEKTNYIPHSFPKEVYFPIPEADVANLISQNFAEKEDWFRILWVNRNAMRKMPGDVLVSFKKFLDRLETEKGHRKAVLIMHTDPSDREGPNLLAMSNELNLNENVWFSTNKLDFNQMNVLYNSVDCTLNIAKAEGFGLMTLSSLQVGKPVVALKTGGETSKVVDPDDGFEYGAAIEPKIRALVGSQVVPYIYEDYADTDDVAAGLMKIHDMTPEEKKVFAEKAIAHAERNFGYHKMVDDWHDTMTRCIEDFKKKKEEKSTRSWKLMTLNPVMDENDGSNGR